MPLLHANNKLGSMNGDIAAHFEEKHTRGWFWIFHRGWGRQPVKALHKQAHGIWPRKQLVLGNKGSFRLWNRNAIKFQFPIVKGEIRFVITAAAIPGIVLIVVILADHQHNGS